TKIDGNPQHPANLGSSDIFAQAAILQLWDPERSQAAIHRGITVSWSEFDAALAQLMQRCQRDRGAGLHLLTGSTTSPLLGAQLDALRARCPGMHRYLHEAAANDNALQGSRLAFGRSLSTRLYPGRARLILSLDADLLTDPAAGVRYARDLISARSPDGPEHSMSRVYVIEPTPSLTGALADHRLALETARLERFACSLARSLGLHISADEAVGAVDAREAQWLQVLTGELQAAHGASLVLVGAAQKPWMHALAHSLNSVLGNVGVTLDYSDAVEQLDAVEGGLVELAAAMRAGTVDTLLVLGANPVYDAPADLQFAAALERVPHLLHLGLYRDETGMVAEWHVPQAHALECWSDARAFDGTASLAQPLIAPLYDGRSAHQILATLLDQDVGDGRELLRRQWQSELPDDAAWDAALQAGIIAGTRLLSRSVSLRADCLSKIELGPAPNGDSLELLFRPDPTIGDGRWANNGWLQELPKPLSQLTWDNAACISPALAARYQLNNGDEVELHLRERALRAPVWVLPGQSPHCITLHLGYGRRSAGRVGNGRGCNAYTLRASDALWCAPGLSLRKTGERHQLAGTQQHFRLEGRDLMRVGTLSDFSDNPDFATAADRYHGAPPSLYPPTAAGQYAWGMSIDLNACIGCKACTIACQAENNIPVVGKEQVLRGREMHWIRVDL
ncbi:MAG TPA: molybdopterin oxidoreductase, partial [Rhodanobacter sp.]